jgi:hypothetical protein
MSGADRQKRRRRRERVGLGVWGTEVHEHRTAQALIVADFLTEDEATSRHACEAALSRAVRIWVAQTLSRVTSNS